jgi:hypothetical protein
MPVPCSLFPLATTALASILLSLLLALLQHHVAARPPQVRCSRFFFKHLCEKSHYPARASRTSYILTARQFWTDLRESAPQPALETSLPVMDTKAHADKSGNLQLPLLQRGEHVDSRSPFSAPKDFFTASAPAGFTSVPSLIFCLYAFRKGILDNSRIVGDYDGMLGLKSKLLFLVTVLSFIFFIIPWCTRFVLYYNYSRISGGNLCRVLPQLFHLQVQRSIERTPAFRLGLLRTVRSGHLLFSNVHQCHPGVWRLQGISPSKSTHLVSFVTVLVFLTQHYGSGGG